MNNSLIFLLIAGSLTTIAQEIPFITLTLPVLGTFNLDIATDPISQEAYFKGELAKTKEIAVGPFKISTGSITLIEDTLTITAPIEIFKQKGTLSVKNVTLPVLQAQQRTLPTIAFTITFDQKPMFASSQLIFTMESGTLTLDQKDGPSFTLQARLKEVDGGSVLITFVGSKESFELTGSFDKAFIFTPIFDVKDVTIEGKTATLTYEEHNITLSINGVSSVFTYPLEAQVILRKKTNETSATVKAFITKPVAFSQLVPKLKKTIADDLIFSRGIVYVSTIAYTDPEEDFSVKPGFTLHAQLDITKSPALKVISDVSDTKAIGITGTLSHNTNDISLVAKMPSITFTDPHLKELALSLIITGEPSLEIEGEIVFVPAATQKPMVGHVTASFESSSLVFNGGLKGCWDNPCDISGLRLCDLSLIIGIEPKTFIATGSPSKLGFSGSLTIAHKTVRMAAVFDAQDSSKMVLLGDLEGTISLLDLALFAIDISHKDTKTKTMLAQKIEDSVPHIALSNLLFKMAPATMTINDKTYYRGLTAQGTAELLKQKASLAFNVGYDGVYAQGYISTLKLGPLSITGPGPDNVMGTEDDGALVTIYATLDKQECTAQGQVTFDDLFNSQTNIYISPLNGITFFTTTKLFNSFSATIDAASTGGLENPDFKANVEFTNELPLMLQNAIEKDLITFQHALDKAAQKANQQLDGARRKIIDQQLKTAGDITKSKEALLQKLDDLRISVRDIQNEIAILERDRTQAKAKLESNPFDIGNIARIAQIAGWDITIAGKTLELGLAQATVQSAEQVVNASATATTTIASKPMSITEKAIEEKVKPMITAILKRVGYLGYTGSTFVANNILNALVLTKVTYTGSLSELAKNRIAKLDIELQLFGAPKKYEINFAFNDVEASTQKAADKVMYTALKTKV